MAPAWRRWGHPHLLPINLTVSANFRCNFRCVTCNVYERKVQELTAGEWAQVFTSLGRAPSWITFSGGEPFLRDDLPDIIGSAIATCRPAVVNIPTNGWFVERVLNGLQRICAHDRRTQVVVNLSMDHHEADRHDVIRGRQRSFGKLLETYHGLRELAIPNLTVGIHTVVSTDNQHDFPAIAEGLAQLGADSYICEPAEERVELQTIGSDITPRGDVFTRAAESVLDVEQRAVSGVVANAVLQIRREYYRRVAQLLDGDREAMPVCHAGFLSAHIGADGDVWPCCVLAQPFGNLRDAGFDFREVWSSRRAEAFRGWMRQVRCACPLANAAYTNLMVEPATVARIATGLATSGRSRRPLPLVSGTPR